MNVSIQQMEKLLRGQYAFKMTAFSLLMTRQKNEYAASPTQAKLEHCVNEINAFLQKYSSVMTEDYAVIQKI